MQITAVPSHLLTLSEAASLLRISRVTLYRRLWAGDLSSLHVGARHFIRAEEVSAYLTRQEALPWSSKPSSA